MSSCSSFDLSNGKSPFFAPSDAKQCWRFSFFHIDTSLVSSWTTQKNHNAKTLGKKLRKSPVVCLPPSGILDDVIGIGHIDFRLRLGQCCVELHYGTVLGKLSLLSLAISRLPRKLGHNSSPKTSHGAILLNRELKQAQQRRQWERQNSNRFRLAKQQLCTHITTWKCLISGFVEDL